MSTAELNEKNYARIYRINWLICGPLLILFGWPFYIIVESMMSPLLAYISALFFSIPFTLTILHGHISVALGVLHRDNYYSWQRKKKSLLRLLLHPALFSTRLRLSLLAIALIFLLVASIVG